MWRRSSYFLGLAASVIVLIAFVSTREALAQGQRGSLQLGRPTASVTVYLRAPDGTPITVGGQISVYSNLRGTPVLNNMGTTGDGWTFSVDTGDEYEIEAQAPGYETTRQNVTVPPEDGFSTSVVIFLKPKSDKPLFKTPSGKFLLAPRAQKEVDKGLKDLSKKNWVSARKHFSKAVEMAPGNPYVNYLLGMSFLLDNQLAAAAPYLEKSVSIDPKEPASQHALGALRFREHKFPGAIEALKQCVQLDPGSWKSHWLLADAYLHLRDYEHARDSGEMALKTAKGQADQVKLILGAAYAHLGQREKAIADLGAFIKEFPKDRNTEAAQWWLNHLTQEANAPAEVTVADHSLAGGPFAPKARPSNDVTNVDLTAVASAPPADIPPRRNWAPADIDFETPYIQQQPECALRSVLDSAEKRAEQLVNDLQRFSAVEDYQWVEIKRNETLGRSASRRFAYVASISRPAPNIIQMDETRDAGINNSDMPGRLADLGAPGLVLAFHKVYRDDFNWYCKGLGAWEGRPAWVIRFEQRSDRPARLDAFVTGSGEFALPLKGLAWVSQRSGAVVHMETDLVKPMKEIGLQREHFVVDYQPVRFQKHNVTLWLPHDVDVYYHFQGHYLHHSHHFSEFKLFWVGSTQQIEKPKETVDPQ